MLLRINHSLAIPLYVQLIDQVKHSIQIGALRPGERLPTIRRVAEDLVMNPNTVARAYRELEHAGVIEVKHGAGAFVVQGLPKPGKSFQKARAIAQDAVERLFSTGLSPDEILRLIENEVALARFENPKVVK